MIYVGTQETMSVSTQKLDACFLEPASSQRHFCCAEACKKTAGRIRTSACGPPFSFFPVSVCESMNLIKTQKKKKKRTYASQKFFSF